MSFVSLALHLYVIDADAAISDAIKAGAKETMPPENQFWGDRMGKVVDPFGHHWLMPRILKMSILANSKAE